MAKPKMPEWGPVMLPVELTSRVDDWAIAHGKERFEAVQYLLELALRQDTASDPPAHRGQGDNAIERFAESQIGGLIAPGTPPEERERRIHRLTEGPPEFVDLRRDLPRGKLDR